MPKILFIGDIVGSPGRAVVGRYVPALRSKLSIDFVIANGENSAGGSGLTSAIARDLADAEIDAVTLGDHVWDQRKFDDEIDDLEHVCRPANLPAACPGRTSIVIECGGFRLGIFTVLGHQFMRTKADCPFLTADRLLKELQGKTDAVLVEIHAEATSEKVAMGWYLDGRAAAVIGTHTHIPTADATVLPRGTAYLTDAGMTGPYASVLGRQVQPVVARFLDGMPRRFPVAEADIRLSGCLIDIDPESGLSTGIELITEKA